MGLENSKRWHWVAVSLVVGPLLAFMNSQAEPGSDWRTLDGAEFEREIVKRELPGDQPNLRNVVVHPPTAGAYDTPVHIVTMEKAVFSAAEKGWRYQPYALRADVPYVTYSPGRRPAQQTTPDRTILTVLEEIRSQNPTVKFSYAWWEEPVWRYALWTGGSLAVIGGAWPTVILLLIGAGLAPKPKEPVYDLERFGKGETQGAPQPPQQAALSDEDRAKLHEQLNKLQENVGTSAVMSDVPAPVPGTPGAATPAPIRQLTGGPVEALAPQKEDDDKEYKGEFYPVAKVVKHDEPAHPH